MIANRVQALTKHVPWPHFPDLSLKSEREDKDLPENQDRNDGL